MLKLGFQERIQTSKTTLCTGHTMLLQGLHLIAFGAVALVPPVIAGSWGTYNTTAVNYKTFEASILTGQERFVGPKGFYTSIGGVDLIYVDATPGAAFSIDYPTEYATFITSVSAIAQKGLGLEFLDVTPVPLVERAVCGDVCAVAGDGQVCFTCECKFESSFCIGLGTCVYIYSCQTK
ncbi:hypothetical protein VTL71DRAFT_7843 [Oculimacula yallundae]|uniref:Uncharacterized protein n=1 Tax=Oculimacula yallundae TaxID=86028 RepID=A0ABR4CW20_9HELO